MLTEHFSLKNNLENWNDHLFCGRDSEIAQFDNLLSRATRTTSLMVIYGIGGVGKSTLVRTLVRRVMSNGLHVAVVSADSFTSPIPILLELSTQLSKEKDTKKYFTDFFKKVKMLNRIENQLRHEIQKDEITPGKVAVEATKGGIGSAAGVIVGTTLAGPIGAVAGGVLGGALGPLVEGFGKAFGKPGGSRSVSKDDAQFLTQADVQLTESFISALNSLASVSKVALFFDAIEYFGETMIWLRDQFLSRLRHKGVIIVLSGRYALPRNEWLVWLPRLVEIELQPFSRQTTHEYLSRYGVKEPQVKDFIYEQAAGLPLAVALWAPYASRIALPETQKQTYPEASQVVEIVTDSLLQKLPNETLRDALRVCSIPRWFNSELLAQLLGTKAGEQEYKLLSGLQPAIRFRTNGLSLHDTVREYLSKSLSLKSPNRYSELHRIARDYFGTLRERLEVANNAFSKEWQTVSLEWIYHQLMLGDVSQFVNEIERSSRFYQHTFAKRLISDVETYHIAVQGITKIYAYHKGQNLIHHNDFLTAIDIFSSILNEDKSSNDIEFSSLVSYQLGKAYFWYGDITNAEIHLGKALDYFESSNNQRMQSHAAIFLSKVDESNNDFRSAIRWRLYAVRKIRSLLKQLKNDDLYKRDHADRLFSLGEAVRLRGTYETALAIHRRCADEREKLKNKFDIGESYIALAKCLINLDRHDEAENLLIKAMAIYVDTDDKYMLGDIRLLLGQLSINTGNITRASLEFKEAAQLAKASQNSICFHNAENLLQRIKILNPDLKIE